MQENSYLVPQLAERPQSPQRAVAITRPEEIRKPMTVSSLDELMENLSCLEDVANSLIKKLSPILSEIPANDSIGKEPPRPPLPPVPAAITLAAERVNKIRFLLADIYSRSEV